MTDPRASLRRLTSGARSSRGSTEDYPRDAELLDGRSRGAFSSPVPWSVEELAALRRMKDAGATVADISRTLGRSESSVRKRVAKEGAAIRVTMSQVRRDVVTRYWGKKTAARIGNIIGLSEERVREAVTMLGLDLAAELEPVEKMPIPPRPRGWSKAEVVACRNAGGEEWALMAGMLGLHGRKDHASRGMQR
jgi:hypothetical protein